MGQTMSVKASVFIATSLDGFIARTDGNIDWLDKANARVPDGEDCGYKAFIDSVDVLVMGRNTFELALTFGEWPYHDKRVLVLSSKAIAIPQHIAQAVSCSSASPGEVVAQLHAQGAKHLYIDGGITIQRLLNADLIDELTITLIPVLLGQGKPLFGPLVKDISLAHIATRTFDFGFVQSKYRVARTA